MWHYEVRKSIKSLYSVTCNKVTVSHRSDFNNVTLQGDLKVIVTDFLEFVQSLRAAREHKQCMYPPPHLCVSCMYPPPHLCVSSRQHVNASNACILLLICVSHAFILLIICVFFQSSTWRQTIPLRCRLPVAAVHEEAALNARAPSCLTTGLFLFLNNNKFPLF